MTHLGHKIKKLRELRNYSQEHLATKLNMSQQNYSKIETGAAKPSEEVLQKIAAALDTEVEAIKKFDSSVAFNVSSNIQSPMGNGNTVHYAIDSRLERLYSDKIAYLETENERLKNEIYGLRKP